MKEKPFFVGWDVTPSQACITKRGWLLLGLSILIAGWIGAGQRTPGKGTFAFGDVRVYKGILIAEPTPMLVSDKTIGGHQLFYLVNPLKRGFPNSTARKHHLAKVEIRGMLIHDEYEAMIEVLPNGVQAFGRTEKSPLKVSEAQKVILRGEIVDSKCHLGAMNPGRFKPHRACAIRCIAGGIPSILVVQSLDGALTYYLLVGTKGESIHRQLLSFVAEPVEVIGETRVVGDRNVLYLNTSNITRL